MIFCGWMAIRLSGVGRRSVGIIVWCATQYRSLKMLMLLRLLMWLTLYLLVWLLSARAQTSTSMSPALQYQQRVTTTIAMSCVMGTRKSNVFIYPYERIYNAHKAYIEYTATRTAVVPATACSIKEIHNTKQTESEREALGANDRDMTWVSYCWLLFWSFAINIGFKYSYMHFI